MRPAFLAILSTLPLLISNSANADWTCAISSSPRCTFMEICEKRASADSCQCAWNFSPDGWTALSQSVWPDIIGFALEPSTTEYGEKRYREAVEKYGENELRAMTKTLAPNGPQPLMKCNAKLASEQRPDVGPVPDEADHTLVCNGNSTTPACSGKLIGTWERARGSDTNSIWTFKPDGTAVIERNGAQVSGKWRIDSPEVVNVVMGKASRDNMMLRVSLAKEVLSLTDTQAPRLPPLILLPVEAKPPAKRNVLPAGVWTIAGSITKSGEESAISPGRLRNACANAFVVINSDGSSQAYNLDYSKLSYMTLGLVFTRHSECASAGQGKEICTSRIGDKAQSAEGTPEFFEDDGSFIYRDRDHKDWPVQRWHRCPFSIEAVKPLLGTNAGSWTDGMKTWSDIQSILDGPGDGILGQKGDINRTTAKFYRSVKTE